MTLVIFKWIIIRYIILSWCKKIFIIFEYNEPPEIIVKISFFFYWENYLEILKVKKFLMKIIWSMIYMELIIVQMTK